MTDHVGVPKYRRTPRAIRLADGDVLTRCRGCAAGVRESWLAVCPSCGREVCVVCWPGSPRRQDPPAEPEGRCRSCTAVYEIGGLPEYGENVFAGAAGRTPDDPDCGSPDSGERADQGQPESLVGAGQSPPPYTGPVPLSVDHSLSRAPGYACAHRMTFAEPVDRAAVEEYVESQRFFGYHPAGYGGVLEPFGDEPRTIWTWCHSHSSD